MYGYELVSYLSIISICVNSIVSRSIKIYEYIKRNSQYSPEVDNLDGLKDSKITVKACITNSESIVSIFVLGKKTEPSQERISH